MSAKVHYYGWVYELVRHIPEGRVTTYGAIADFLALGSARMVGWALNQSHRTDPTIPAHRVVNRKGELTGRNHFPTPGFMQEELEKEGLAIEEHRIQGFEEAFIHPEEFYEDPDL